MGKDTKIEWTDSTWNPWIGCTRISPGCQNCYMFREQARWGGDPNQVHRTSDKTFYAPDKWGSARIFVCSWSDFFHPDITPQDQEEAMDVIYRNQRHTFLILTKRPENIFILHEWWTRCPNVWLGVSVENREALKRIDAIRDIPAKVKFISAEPLLEYIDIEPYIMDLDWIIVGGESGSNARPFDPEWAREIYKICSFYQVPFFMKQMGGKSPTARQDIPADLLIREFPI